MALVVTYGADTLSDAGTTALGNINDTGLPFLRLDLENDAAPTLTGIYAAVSGDGMLGGFNDGYETMLNGAVGWVAMELDVSSTGAGSTTITITHDGGSWSHTFTFTVVAGASLIETVTFESFTVLEAGDKFEALFSVPAEILIDGETTLSSTTNGDDILLTISDSANGLDALSAGDQVYMSGWTSDHNNQYWMAMAIAAGTAKLQCRHAPAGRNTGSYEFDGATEAAGNAITISKVPCYTTATTMGTFTLESDTEADRTATVRQVNVWHDVDHRVYISVKGKLSSRVSGDETLTVSATAGAAWELEYGQGNDALSSVAVINRSWIKDKDLGLSYDNFVHLTGREAPVHVGAALDPTGEADLIDWWAPDLESGYSDGDPIYEMTGQENGLTLQTKDGVTDPQTYRTGVFPGSRAGTEQEGRDNTWTSTTHLGSWTANNRTFYVVRYYESPHVNEHVWWNNQRSNEMNSVDYAFEDNTGCIIEAISVDTSGNVVQKINYTTTSYNGLNYTGQIRIGGSVATSQPDNHIGRIFAFNTAHDSAKMDRIIRWILDDHDTPWQPDYYVNSSGNDSNAGTEASPLATIGEVFTRCGTFSSPRIHLTEGEEYSGGLGSAHNSLLGGFYSHHYMFGLTRQDPIVVLVDRTSAEWPTARVPLTTGGKIIDQQSDGQFWSNFVMMGVCGRDEVRIPTDSPIREVGDAAYDSASQTNPAPNIFSMNYDGTTARSELFNDEAIISHIYFGIFNCHGAGTSVGSPEIGPTTCGKDISVAVAECSSVHDHGSGHTINMFIEGPVQVYLYNTNFPEGGHDTAFNAVEAADTRSRAIYAQYRKTCRIVHDGQFAVQDSSGQQYRNGAYLDRIFLVDNETGIGCWFGEITFDRLIVHGGARADGLGGSQTINWGPNGQFGYGILRNVLMLPERTGTQIRNIHVRSDLADRLENGTLGGRGLDYFSVSKRQSRFLIEHITNAGRDGPLLQMLEAHNVTLRNVLHKADQPILEIDNTTAGYEDTDLTSDLVEGGLTVQNVVQDGTSDFATINGTTRTEAQIHGITNVSVSDFSSDTITFVDDTMDADAYADDLMGTGNDSLDLAYEMAKRRWDNAVAASGYSFDELWDGVWYSYLPTDQTKDGNGYLPGAVQERPTFTSKGPADGGSATDAVAIIGQVSEDVVAGVGTAYVRDWDTDTVILTITSVTINAGTEVVFSSAGALTGETGRMYLEMPAGFLVSDDTGEPMAAVEKGDWDWTIGSNTPTTGFRDLSRNRTSIRIR